MNDKASLPFPTSMPSSTADPDAIGSNDWSAFARLRKLDDHWRLKHWPLGRTGYYWYLTFDDERLAALAQKCQAQLGTDVLDPIPQGGLHITLSAIGDTQDVSDAQVSELVALAEQSLSGSSPFDLLVGPLAGSRSAVRFSVAPWDPLLELHQVLLACTARVLPGTQARERTTSFRPHLGIGYVNTAQPAGDLIERVAALRELPLVWVRVDSVDLVALRREGRTYRWDNRAKIRLAGHSDSGTVSSRVAADHSRR